MNAYHAEHSKYVRLRRRDGWTDWVERDRVDGRPLDAEKYATAFRARDTLTRQYSWAVPTEEAIARIAKWSPIVEMGAGTGYWASLLAEAGATVHAWDPEPHKNHYVEGDHFQVLEGGPEVLAHEKYEGWTLLLCWLPMNDAMSSALRSFAGRRAVVVGEGPGGCTGDDLGHALLGRETYCDHEPWQDEYETEEERDAERERRKAECAVCHVEPEWRSVGELSIPQWPGLHDYVEFFERSDDV